MSNVIADGSTVMSPEPSGSDHGESVIDLSVKKTGEDIEPVKLEIIPSVFEVNISDLIIDTEAGGDHEQTKQPHKRAKKRKQPPEKIIEGYVIEEAPETQQITVIQAPEGSHTFVVSNGEDVDVENFETVLEVETSQSAAEALVTPSPLKIPTVNVPSTVVATTSDDSLTSQLPTSLLGTSLFNSNGKSVRPFKLYTQNRDLLAGIGLDEDNMNTIAAALSGRPVMSPTVEGSTASVPVGTLSENPLIPTTIRTGVPSAAISKVGSTAINSVAVTTTTPSAMRLMTLATEADKILKEKKQVNLSPTNKNNKNVPLLISTSDSSSTATGHIQEDGTLQVTLDPQSKEKLAFLQQRIAMLTDGATSKKKKKDRQTLPETMKTENYWERRRKNNEAAKRSRDARRAKEDQIAIRAAMLEHENTKLKIELQALREEVAQLRAEIYERKKADSK